MASIFLSYAREDLPKAEPLAKALERAGHKVWWDRHIYSGSEFSGEIEAALKRADAVLVMWSKASVNSAWVRDEAAEGRDTDRLVPVVLDDSRPPIGFRQFQGMDLSRWSGRGAPPHFQDLLAAIARKVASAGADDEGAPASDQLASGRNWRRLAVPAVAVLLLVVLLVAALAWRSSNQAADKPILAVLPFADLSARKDQAFISEGMAEAILTTLGRDPGIKVIGRTSSWQFKDGAADIAEIRKALGVTHVLEGSARTSGEDLRVSVRLIDASDGAQVWSEEYQRQISNIFAVQDEIGRAVAERLRGSFAKAVPKPATQMTGADTYTLHLAARAKARNRQERPLREALELSRKAIAADPNYAPAHALHAELVWLISSMEFDGFPSPEGIRTAEAHARRAIQLAPNLADGYAALGLALTTSQPEVAAQALSRAIALDPARGELRLWLAEIYNNLYRNAEALEQFRAAAAMEPLWPPAVGHLHQVLVHSKLFDEADKLLREFQSRGGEPAAVAQMRAGTAAVQRKNVPEGNKHLLTALRAAPDSRGITQALMWEYHILGLTERAERLARRESPIVRLYVAGRHDDIVRQARENATAMWSHPDFDIAAELLVSAQDWKTLAAIYDARSTPPPGLCRSSRTAQTMLDVATALKALGRSGEASALVACVEQAVAAHARGPIRAPGFPEFRLAQLRSQILAFRGQGARALREMGRAADLGHRLRYGVGLGRYPAFDPLRSTREYAALDQRLKQLTASDREKTLRDLNQGT